MKKIILALAFLVTTVTIAQNSLFNSISEDDQYQEYLKVWDEDGDGFYKISDKRYVTKFKKEYLPTGEGYKISSTVVEGEKKGKDIMSLNAADRYYTCSGYPYETVIKHKYDKDGVVAIGDYIFVLSSISADGTSFKYIDDVFIKIDKSTVTKSAGAKKKKMSFKEKLKALKNAANGTANYGPEHKALESKNLKKMITDYLVVMKAKQNARTAKQKQGDKNIVAARERGENEIKRYNDSIKATPKYQKMKAHQARMEQMDKNNGAKTVTINNRTGKDIYIYKEGARNGTRINVNSSTKVDCSSNYSYKFDSNSNGGGSRCYNANSGCGKSVTIK